MLEPGRKLLKPEGARLGVAASSIALGVPCRRRRGRITSSHLAALAWNPGVAAAARWANSSTASRAAAAQASGSGRGSGGLRQQCSPSRFISCLLVASIVTCARSAAPVSASAARAPIKCSAGVEVEQRLDDRAGIVHDHVRLGPEIFIRQPETVATVCGGRVRIVQTAQFSQAHAVGELNADAGSGAQRDASLSHAAGTSFGRPPGPCAADHPARPAHAQRPTKTR